MTNNLISLEDFLKTAHLPFFIGFSSYNGKNDHKIAGLFKYREDNINHQITLLAIDKKRINNFLTLKSRYKVLYIPLIKGGDDDWYVSAFKKGGINYPSAAFIESYKESEGYLAKGLSEIPKDYRNSEKIAFEIYKNKWKYYIEEDFLYILTGRKRVKPRKIINKIYNLDRLISFQGSIL